MKNMITFSAACLLVGISSGFINESFADGAGSVQIGTQTWTTENLNTDTFRNGDAILYVNTKDAWQKAGVEKKPAYCYYEDDPSNMYTYGKLYNWYAVNDPRGLAPTGWHIPSDSDWTVLSNYLGGKEIAGKKMKSTTGWFKGGAGTNESKFNALPGSYRWPSGVFLELGTTAQFWSSTEIDTGEFGVNPWQYSLSHTSDKLNRDFNNKENGMSVRLVKD